MVGFFEWVAAALPYSSGFWVYGTVAWLKGYRCALCTFDAIVKEVCSGISTRWEWRRAAPGVGIAAVDCCVVHGLKAVVVVVRLAGYQVWVTFRSVSRQLDI